MKLRIWDKQQYWYGTIRDLFGHLPNDIKDDQIQFCTGFTDTTGKDIYIGDIIEFDDGVGEVSASLNGPVVLSRNGNNGFIWKDFYNKFEVIGNNYESTQPLVFCQR